MQKFRSTKKQMAFRNEATIAVRLMPFLIKEERRKGDDVLNLEDLAARSSEAARERLYQSFENDGIFVLLSTPIVFRCLFDYPIFLKPLRN